MPTAGFRRFSVVVLGFTLAVILWGAYVRASGSGAGCGSHWPTCNGEVIPRAPSIATVIELTHRATSGIAFMLVLAQVIWAWRSFPRRHAARRAATVAMALMVTEALVGAGLVVFEMVADNKSIARAAWMEAHLLNTFALVAAQTLTIWFAKPSSGSDQRAAGAKTKMFVATVVGIAGMLLVALSGAVAALGDTLFPVASLAEGLRADLSPTTHLFVRLRVWHPLIAVVVGAWLLAVSGAIVVRDRPLGLRPLATLLAALVLAQLGVGLLNLALLAPIPLQIVHLLLADLVWVTLVLLAARAAVVPATEQPSGVEQRAGAGVTSAGASSIT